MILLLLMSASGLLFDGFIALFLQLLVAVGAVIWGVRAYFVARAEIKAGVTPACSSDERAAVFFFAARPDCWRFRFFSRPYAGQFAAVNPGGSVTELLL